MNAREAVDRHATGPLADRIALGFLRKSGATEDATCKELRAATNRFANALRSLGLGSGDRVFLLAGRIPELYVAALGALKNRCVVTPLFAAFGPEPIRARVEMGRPRVLVTTGKLFARKVAREAVERPWAIEGALIARPVVTATLAGDHSPPGNRAPGFGDGLDSV